MSSSSLTCLRLASAGLALVCSASVGAARTTPLHPAPLVVDDAVISPVATSTATGQTSAASDSFVWGPWTFENGWDGWSPRDFHTVDTVYGHAQDLTLVPGSRGNGALFIGKVEWLGRSADACARSGCFPGYENNAGQILFKTYAPIPAGARLAYKFRNDTEPGYDFTHVFLSTNGPPTVQTSTGSYVLPVIATGDTVRNYSGFAEGRESIDLSSFAGQTLTVIFFAQADAGYSDQDCSYNSLDGMFEIDSLSVGAEPAAEFESSDGGWAVARTAGDGGLARLEPISLLPMADACPSSCGISGNCVTVYDPAVPGGPYRGYIDDGIISPIINLSDNPSYPLSSYSLQFDVYSHGDVKFNGNLYFWQVRYSPVEGTDCSCLDPNAWSDWISDGLYINSIATCSNGRQFNLSSRIPGHAQRVQIGLGVYVIVTSESNGGDQSPYFDNVSLRSAKISAPALVVQPWEYLQDSYPDASTFALAKSTPAFVDAANNVYPSRTKTRLADSSTCSVALSCTNAQQVEVDYLFKVTPGPCLDTTHPWWQAYQAQPRIGSGPYEGFVVARADTARSNGLTIASATSATFMSDFHESPPAPGTTYASYGNWSAYTGGAQGIAMFPDNLFTPGSHIEWVMHSTYIPVMINGDAYLPSPKYGNGDGDRRGNQIGNQHWRGADGSGTYDPTATYVEEFEVLPLTTQDGNATPQGCTDAQPAHCFLYVDKADQLGVQPVLENAFRNLAIAWDRFDVRGINNGNDLGSRYAASNYPLGHANGPQLPLLKEVYKEILWNTGAVTSSNFSYGSTSTSANTGDAVDLLKDWLTTTSDGKYLWVSGDGNARFLNATGARLTFLNTVLGAVYSGAQYRDKNSAWGITLTGLGPDCTAGLSYGLRANWCPERRAFNYVSAYTGAGSYGTITANWKYPDASGTWYAGTQQVATTGGRNFRTQLDLWSLDQLRQVGVAPGNETNENIAAWAARALSSCFTGCFANLALTAADDPAHVAATRLDAVRSPTRAAMPVQIRYALQTAGTVTLRLYDAGGRLVDTLVEGPQAAGAHAATWSTVGHHAGVYFYQMETGGFRSARRVILVR